MQPRTPRQTANRSFLTNGSSAWRTLSDAQRTAWNDYAAQISRSDSLGSSYQPTGQELFAGSIIASQDLTITAPPGTLPLYVLGINGMTYVDPTPGPEALTVDISATSANNSMLVETSGPVSPGITSAAAVRRWRALPTSASGLFARLFGMSASPVAILTYYKYLFPSPAAGQVIWFRFREVFLDGSSPAGIVNKLALTFRLPIT